MGPKLEETKMVNKPKAQGTRFETRIVQLLQEAGLYAQRLPEGGPNDEGDIEIHTDHRHFIIETKDRQRLNIHDALAAATTKAPNKHVAVSDHGTWFRSGARHERRPVSEVAGVPVGVTERSTIGTL